MMSWALRHVSPKTLCSEREVYKDKAVEGMILCRELEGLWILRSCTDVRLNAFSQSDDSAMATKAPSALGLGGRPPICCCDRVLSTDWECEAEK